MLSWVFAGRICQFVMPPSSKKFRGHIGLGLCVRVCVRPSVTLCMRSRTVRDRNLEIWYVELVWKIRGPVFFLFPLNFSLQTYAPFTFFSFFFVIISLWNLVNKISGEPLGLGSWYLADRLRLRCRWPDYILVKFYQCLAELSPFSNFGILYRIASMSTKYLENRFS